MQDLILRTVKESNFDETKRIEELLEFISSDNEKSVIQNADLKLEINQILLESKLTVVVRETNILKIFIKKES